MQPGREGTALLASYAFAIYSSMTSLVAAASMEAALRMLKTDGLSQTPAIPMFDFMEFCRLIGFEPVRELQRRWARAPDSLDLQPACSPP